VSALEGLELRRTKAFGYAARDERSHGDWDFTCYERSID